MERAQKQRNARIQAVNKTQPLHILLPDDFCIHINLPASKSISNRALIINSLSGGKCTFDNLSDCDDTQTLRHALQTPDEKIDVGVAGTAMRFLTAYLAIQNGHRELIGSERMKKRPVGPLVETLQKLGADIVYSGQNGFPPLSITGRKLHGGVLAPEFGESSQFYSALMMIAPYIDGGLTLHLPDKPTSQPYIAMTAAMMRQSGAKIEICQNCIRIAESRYRPTHFDIENDWSAASYWYELAAVAQKGTYILHGLRPDSLQGDSKIAALCETFGVVTQFDGNNATIAYKQGSRSPVRFDYDFGSMPDMAQTFAVLCCARNVPFRFSGLGTLRIKETDRIAALAAELRKCGFATATTADSLTWDGTCCHAHTQPHITTYGDHRMVMAFAPLAALQPLTIEAPEAVSKSYPNFWNEWAKLT